MATRAHFEKSCEIGVFSKLTNTYCLTAIGASENFYRYQHVEYIKFYSCTICLCTIYIYECLHLESVCATLTDFPITATVSLLRLLNVLTKRKLVFGFTNP